MKIWAFSDIHMIDTDIGIERIFPKIPQADLAVCSGDLVEGGPAAAVRWLADHIRPQLPVVVVMGNHEYYNPRENMHDLRTRAREVAAELDVHLLDDRYVDIGGVRVFGSTLWTDFDIFSGGNEQRRQADMLAAHRSMNDFRLIFESGHSSSRWTPAAARLQHQKSLAWLEQSLAENFEGPKLVVTHHAPHPMSIAQQFAHDPVTAAFVSDLTSTIERFRPALWLHGHTHTSFDYHVGTTRVVCNPKGYGRENARAFDPGMIVEI